MSKGGSEMVKPFLKWAGGKRQLISEIMAYYPFEKSKITKYAEPFVGGGAILFDILNKYDLDSIYISDTNFDLINTYKVIRDNIDKLVKELLIIQNEFLAQNDEERKNYYTKKRDRFNELKTNSKKYNIERATLMIFLNRTCFNGLFRVNKNGMFNVPMGRYKNPLICDEVNLRKISKKLKKVEIVYGDYKKSIKFIDENTFVYFDPPYRPLTKTANFTSYTKYDFTDEKQIELSQFIDTINKKGAKIVLSNSDPKNIDENDNFFDEIYSDYNIKRIIANRFISCKGNSREKVKELIIANYDI